MSLTFPRAMPALGAATNLFEPDRADFLSRDGRGRLASMSAGFPLWRGEWTLGQGLTPAQSDEWRAFVASLGGASRLFYGSDVERPQPKAHPAGLAADFGGWNGDLGTWSQSISADGLAVLTIHGAVPGLKMSLGDYIGFRWTTGGAQRRALVRSLEALTVGGGGTMAITVEPAVPAVVPSDATPYLTNPVCLMRLDPRNTKITAMDRRKVVGGTIVAVQDLIP